MNQEIKTKWVAALRSGEYTQAKGKLKIEESFCCLGVLCDLHSKEKTIEWNKELYLEATGMLPEAVKEWANIDSSNGNPVIINKKSQTLAWHNDENSTFLEIADAIENQL